MKARQLTVTFKLENVDADRERVTGAQVRPSESMSFTIGVPALADNSLDSLSYLASTMLAEDKIANVIENLCSAVDSQVQHAKEAAMLTVPDSLTRDPPAKPTSRSAKDVLNASVEAARAAAGISAPELPLEFPEPK